jgi:hypothetical protein
LSENPDNDEVKNEYSKWIQIFEELIVLHEENKKLVCESPTDKNVDDQEFQNACERFQAVKASLEDWMLQHATPDNKSVHTKLSSKASSSRLSMEKLKEQ